MAQADAAIGRALGYSRRAGIDETGDQGEGPVDRTALACGLDATQERVLQVIANTIAKRLRVGAHRQTMECGGGEVHARDFLEGSSLRARAAVTWPSSLAASWAATFRPCAVMR